MTDTLDAAIAQLRDLPARLVAQGDGATAAALATVLLRVTKPPRPGIAQRFRVAWQGDRPRVVDPLEGTRTGRFSSGVNTDDLLPPRYVPNPALAIDLKGREMPMTARERERRGMPDAIEDRWKAIRGAIGSAETLPPARTMLGDDARYARAQLLAAKARLGHDERLDPSTARYVLGLGAEAIDRLLGELGQ